MVQGPKPWITGYRNWRCPFDDRTMARSGKGSLFLGIRLRRRRVSASSPWIEPEGQRDVEPDVELSCGRHTYAVPWKWLSAAHHRAEADGYREVRVPRRFAVNAKRS